GAVDHDVVRLLHLEPEPIQRPSGVPAALFVPIVHGDRRTGPDGLGLRVRADRDRARAVRDRSALGQETAHLIEQGERTTMAIALRKTEKHVDALGDATEAASLVAEDVHAWFGTHHVLGPISLEMPANSVTALIGPSGCGKSTFLRIINRMHELVPSAQLAGQIWLNGVDIYGPEVRPTDVRRRIGMVFQKPNPFPAMTIAENVMSGLKLSGLKTSDADALVEDCLTRAGLWREVKDRLK